MLDNSMEIPRSSASRKPSSDVMHALTRALAHLSDAEIESLEDDLNFFAFTGITSARIEGVLAAAGVGPVTHVANSNAATSRALAS